MAWHGQLALRYRRDADGTTRVLDRHDGPLRVLKSLHGEAGICQSVLVHPPGGIVGGDTLAIEVDLEPGSHALITTAGAARFYRSAGDAAEQRASVRVGAGARLEWLPLESIAFDGCLAANRVVFALEPGAETIGWDLTALGLPASDRPFRSGRYTQEIAVAGRWLDRGSVAGSDRRLLDSPLGWAGRRALATMWFAAGADLDAARRDRLLDAARESIDAVTIGASPGDAFAAAGEAGGGDDPVQAGATAVDSRVIVVRALAAAVEPAMALCQRVWQAWRTAAWGLAAVPPRVWRT